MRDPSVKYTDLQAAAIRQARDRSKREQRRMTIWSDGHTFWVRPSDDPLDGLDPLPAEAAELATWSPQRRGGHYGSCQACGSNQHVVRLVRSNEELVLCRSCLPVDFGNYSPQENS